MAKINGREVEDEELDVLVFWNLITCGTAGWIPLRDWLDSLRTLWFQVGPSTSIATLTVEVEDDEATDSLTRLIRAGHAVVFKHLKEDCFVIDGMSTRRGRARFPDGFEEQILRWREEAIACGVRDLTNKEAQP